MGFKEPCSEIRDAFVCISRLIHVLIKVWNVTSKLCSSLDLPQIYYLEKAGYWMQTVCCLPSTYHSAVSIFFSLPLPPYFSKWHIPYWKPHLWHVLMLGMKTCVHSAQNVPGKCTFSKILSFCFSQYIHILFSYHRDFKIVLCKLNKISKNSKPFLQGKIRAFPVDKVICEGHAKHLKKQAAMKTILTIATALTA